jgi:hypothetical protein
VPAPVVLVRSSTTASDDVSQEVSRTDMTTTMCFNTRMTNLAARGLVPAGRLLADKRVS